jgi:Secretin and TonB N terminus short domain
MCTTVLPENGGFLDRFRACCVILAIWIGVSIGQACSVAAAEMITSDENNFNASIPVNFDIPAQPLVSALNAYSSAMHMDLFYDGALVVGRQSSAIQGALTPSDALRRLLDGSGLVVRLTDAKTIAISKPDNSSAEQLAVLKRRSAGYWPYLSRIQLSVREAFCRQTSTPLVTGDVVLRLWIAPSGAVARAELSIPAGSSIHDAAYAVVMSKINIGEPPPSNMPQPVTMMIMAQPDGAGCVSSSRHATAR